MRFLAGFILGLTAALAWAYVYGRRGRLSRRRAVLHPSITAGLEGLSAFPEPIALTEGDRILFFNPAFAREAATFAAQQTWEGWLGCLAPGQGLSASDAPPRRVQRTGERADVQLRTSSGRIVHWTAAPYPGLGRKLVLNIVRDVTASAAKDDQVVFLNRAAHELKTPITAIKGYAEVFELLAAKGKTLPPDAARRIVDQSNRLVHLVNQLLDASRLAAGRLKDEPEPVRLGALLEAVAAKVRAAFPGRMVEVRGEADPLTLLDPERFEQVARELLFNALKYSPADRPVTITLRTEHDLAVLTVADQGIGIPLDEQARIYDRFVRASNVSEMPQAGGFGLGLYLARQILERWHGDIRIESEPGRGTRVTAAWPLRHPPHRGAEAGAGAGAPAGQGAET